MRLLLCCLSLIVVFAIVGGSGDTRCRSDADAYSAAEQLVSKNLVSPGSAQFASITDPSTKITTIRDCYFRVVSFVDSQNRAGGLMRTYYSIDFEYVKSSAQWTQRDLSFKR